jgi:hypothetical protein
MPRTIVVMRSTEGRSFSALAYLTPSFEIAVEQQRDHQPLADFQDCQARSAAPSVERDRGIVIVIDIGGAGGKEGAGKVFDGFRIEDRARSPASSVLAASLGVGAAEQR